jgi:pyrimidine-nucleoside phosphorylase
MSSYNPVELILKKRNGDALTKQEIEFFVTGFLDGSIPDYQMSTLLLAIYFKGLTIEEITDLTKCYIKSGKELIFAPGLITADKHSTGGVGDKISLMLAPIAAALGLYVPMISGRGLGHTGGTLDKLESIPGFNTQYSMEEFKALVEKHGYALVGQSEELVPADKQIYALRDVTGTVESVGLITASIMSKKIAEGAKNLVIDLKIGSGAFMPNLEKAEELAKLLILTGKSFGQNVSVIFSNMNSPLGAAVGNALEVIEAIEYLKGNYKPDTEALTTALVTEMLLMSGKTHSEEEAVSEIARVIKDGSALNAFREIILAQGGDPAVIDDYTVFGKAEYCLPITAENEGYIQEIDSGMIGYALIKINAGRMKVTDQIDYTTGATLPLKIGDFVKKGDLIGLVHANDEARGQEVVSSIRRAYTITEEECTKQDIIYKIERSYE